MQMTESQGGYAVGGTICKLTNPLTGREVDLTPGYRLTALTPEGVRAEFEALWANWERFCEAAWALAYLDPAEVYTPTWPAYGMAVTTP